MASPNLLEIERSIGTLSFEEQLWLLEHIARQIRERTHAANHFSQTEDIEKQLAVMASDPAIQAELAAINREFAITEIDGLEQQRASIALKSIS